MTDLKTKVEGLHRAYCALTERVVPVRFFERAWFELLRSPEYEGDDQRMLEDAKLIVRYLRKMISQGKRNPGALKLTNFLQPDRWAEDLAEARLMVRTRPAQVAPTRASEAPEEERPTPEEEDEIRRKAAAGLKAFGEKLKR